MFGEVLIVNLDGNSALLIRAKGCTDGESTNGYKQCENHYQSFSWGEPFTSTIKEFGTGSRTLIFDVTATKSD